MLEKLTNLTEQISAKVDFVKENTIQKTTAGAERIGLVLGDVTQTLTENAVRVAVDQLRKSINIAVDEWANNPGKGESPVLTATASLPGVSLQIQVDLKSVN
jgi:hypothetical protein